MELLNHHTGSQMGSRDRLHVVAKRKIRLCQELNPVIQAIANHNTCTTELELLGGQGGHKPCWQHNMNIGLLVELQLQSVLASSP